MCSLTTVSLSQKPVNRRKFEEKDKYIDILEHTLNNQWVKDEIVREIRNCCEMKKMKTQYISTYRMQLKQ